MAKQVILSCDEAEHIKKRCAEKANGKVEERTYEWEGKSYEMDMCVDADAITLAKIAEARRVYEETMREILKPAIDAERFYDTPIPEPVPTQEELAEKYGSALDLAVKDLYARELLDREQPNPNRKRVAKKFLDVFLSKEDVWEGWEIGDPIPEGWIYDGKTCMRIEEEAPAVTEQQPAA